MNATLPQGPAAPRAHPADLPDAATIGPREVADWVGVSTREIDRRIKRASFPKPLRGFGPQTRRWLVGAVRAWLQARSA